MSEKIKELIGEELYSQVTEKLGEDVKIDVLDKNYIPLTRFNEVIKERDELQTQLGSMAEQVKGLEELTGKNQELADKIKEMNEKHTEAMNKFKEEMLLTKKNGMIDMMLNEYKARNPKAVKALLDSEKISLDGENLLGIREQLDALVKSDPYLFNEKKQGGNPNAQQNQQQSAQQKGDPLKRDYVQELKDARAKKDSLTATRIIREAAKEGVTLI